MGKAVHQSQVETNPVNMEGVSGAQIQWLINQQDNAPNFYMRRFTLAPNGHTPKHTHPYEHEVYILSGSGRVLLDDKWHNFEKDCVVYVEPDLEHQFQNTGTEPLVFLCLIPKT